MPRFVVEFCPCLKHCQKKKLQYKNRVSCVWGKKKHLKQNPENLLNLHLWVQLLMKTYSDLCFVFHDVFISDPLHFAMTSRGNGSQSFTKNGCFKWTAISGPSFHQDISLSSSLMCIVFIHFHYLNWLIYIFSVYLIYPVGYPQISLFVTICRIEMTISGDNIQLYIYI